MHKKVIFEHLEKRNHAHDALVWVKKEQPGFCVSPPRGLDPTHPSVQQEWLLKSMDLIILSPTNLVLIFPLFFSAGTEQLLEFCVYGILFPWEIFMSFSQTDRDKLNLKFDPDVNPNSSDLKALFSLLVCFQRVERALRRHGIKPMITTYFSVWSPNKPHLCPCGCVLHASWVWAHTP